MKESEMSTHELFSGQPHSQGGLSNEGELVQRCPAQFGTENPWFQFARLFNVHGADIRQWTWKVKDRDTQTKQLHCLVGLLSSKDLSETFRVATAGWMLSEMLVELPEHYPPSARLI